jgi:hypothetical protein
MPETVLGDVASWETLLRGIGFTWLLRLPTWGSIGWASLSPTPSYGLQLLEEGRGHPIRCCLVPSSSSV